MKLKQKQKAFIAEYVANGRNGVQAALKVYDTSDYNTANQIASRIGGADSRGDHPRRLYGGGR